MKIKRLFKNKQAFSAVIASLILMLLAVAAGVVVYGYVMGWIGGATKNPTRAGQMQFDSIYADSTASTISIYIRNTGGTNLNVSDVYIQGTKVDSSDLTITPSAVLLSPQSTLSLVVGNYTMEVSRFYEVAVVCLDGTTIAQSVEAK